MDGGGGFEIWQYTSRPTHKPDFQVQLGDFGLTFCKIKSRNIDKSFSYFKEKGAKLLSDVIKAPHGGRHFIVEDPYGNLFDVVEGLGWFGNTNHPSFCGGVAGTTLFPKQSTLV